MRIAVVAPARPLEPAHAEQLNALIAAEFPEVALDIDRQCFLRDGHFAGDDAARAEALLRVANDPSVDAVWFARGGYGSNRLLDRVIPQLGEAAHAKTYLGYSDMGFLLGALYAQGIGRPVHAPMPGDLVRAGGTETVRRTLAWLVRGDCLALEPGLDTRPSVAFNLTILAALIGTPWLPDLDGHVLLIEEVSEPLYRIDRLLFQLANTPALRTIAGIRLGRLNEIPANDPPWTEPVQAMIGRWCGALGVPHLGQADIGHDAANRVVPFGRSADR